MSRRKRRRAEEIVAPVAVAAPARMAWDTGTKFAGGFGATKVLIPDYWTLRARSSQLFETNLYARGLVRRLVTNIINTGLHLESMPEEGVLGVPRDSLAEWSEDVEIRWNLWAGEPWLCDFAEQATYGEIQEAAFLEALIAGDCLVVLRQDPLTRLPRVQLVKGDCVQSPARLPRGGNKIEHGVEIDAQRRQVAYWIRQEDGSSKRLPAYGEKSGRRLAWLVYASDRRLDQVRGKPILSLALQAIQEIDRYRDSTQRKATINSMLAMFVEKTAPTSGTRPMTNGAVRSGSVAVANADGTPRRFNVSEQIPGLVLDELAHGEIPRAFPSNGTDLAFGEFERAILAGVAWGFEIPPEILVLSFGSNYSASQAAINEFKIFLNKVRTRWGERFCQPMYVEWILASVLAQKITADRLVESWRDWKNYDVFCAWVNADWSGNIKPAVDLSKLVKAYVEMIKAGLITRARAARELTGTKFSRNAQTLAIENLLMATANEPIERLENPAPVQAPISNNLPSLDDEVDDDGNLVDSPDNERAA